MSTPFVFKDKIEELEKKFDMMIDEKQMRDFTRSVVIDASQEPVETFKSDLRDLVEEARYTLEREHTRIESEIDGKMDADVAKLAESLTSRMDAIEQRMKRAEILIGFTIAISVFAALLAS
jgi:hypothetical protein